MLRDEDLCEDGLAVAVVVLEVDALEGEDLFSSLMDSFVDTTLTALAEQVECCNVAEFDLLLLVVAGGEVADVAGGKHQFDAVGAEKVLVAAAGRLDSELVARVAELRTLLGYPTES